MLNTHFNIKQLYNQQLFFTVLFFITIFFSGCKKDQKADEIKYEVTLIKTNTWHGSYFNEDGYVVGIDNAPDNWTYTFYNTKKLLTLVINAYPDGLNVDSDAIMKIFINGKIVASGKSSLFPQVQYIYQ